MWVVVSAFFSFALRHPKEGNGGKKEKRRKERERERGKCERGESWLTGNKQRNHPACPLGSRMEEEGKVGSSSMDRWAFG